MIEHVKVSRGYPKLKLLEEIICPPRLDKIRVHKSVTKDQVDLIFEPIKKTDFLAVDFETRGLTPTDSTFRMIGVGLGFRTGSTYIDFRYSTQDVINYVLAKLLGYKCLGHNVCFDGWVYYNHTGVHLNWFCTYAGYGYLANDTTFWGLKDAMVRVLGWESSNEAGLDNWLISNGYIKGSGAVLDSDDTTIVTQKLERIQVRQSVEGNNLRPDKGEMWRAPVPILGHYCALDAEATYALYKKVLLPSLNIWGEAKTFLDNIVMTRILIQIEHLESGIWVDKDQLEEVQTVVSTELVAASKAVLEHSEVAPFLKEYNASKVKEEKDKEPTKYLKVKAVGFEPPKYTKEPNKYTNKGAITKSWEAWNFKGPSKVWLAWCVRVNNSASKTISKNWIKWADRMKDVESKNHFNIMSPNQLSKLLYHHLHTYQVIEEYKDERSRGRILLLKDGKPVIELEYAKKGGLPTDKVALSWMGNVGEVVLPFKKLMMELQFITKTLKLIDHDQVLRPGTRIPGTVTGRGAGKNPNFQQVMKSARMLECYKPRPGNVWVQFDFDALENKLLAEFSRDPNLLELYGPGSKPHCGYMFFGLNVPEYRTAFVEAGYDPKNPTKEGVAKAKKKCKALRSVCKTIVLAKQYGAGIPKIHSNLVLAKLNPELSFTKSLCDAYDNTFKRVAELNTNLFRMSKKGGGVLVNSTGRPLAITKAKQKDLINSLCQSSGVDRLHIMLCNVDRLLQSEGIPGTWAYPDFHDEFCFETKPEFVEKVVAVFNTGLAELNDMFKAKGEIVPLTGTPEVHYNLATIKCD